ncbi:VOC family protein [Bradyrhizobium sp.]|uniref:VOC family protein n=1 Tax=Bradyrhizobium sp. TaxID=376 RepID=UPI003C3899E8
MPHGLDHIVHTVRDLDAAGEFYRRLGFIVSARNRHSWGTHNRIVQLANGFVEILEVAEPDKVVPHAARAFSFGAFHRDYATSRQGLSMLILSSRNAVEDARAFQTAGISEFEVFNFAREGKKPDGTPVKLAFSLVFACEPGSPDLSFALCQHHFPENFWDPAFQIHGNGARKVSGVVMVADNPTDHHVFLKAFIGTRDLHASSIGVKADVGNGDVDIMEPVAFRDQFGVLPEVGGAGMTLNAIRFQMADVDATEATLRSGGLTAQRHAGRLVLAPDFALGATLIFENAKRG